MEILDEEYIAILTFYPEDITSREQHVWLWSNDKTEIIFPIT